MFCFVYILFLCFVLFVCLLGCLFVCLLFVFSAVLNYRPSDFTRNRTKVDNFLQTENSLAHLHIFMSKQFTYINVLGLEQSILIKIKYFLKGLNFSQFFIFFSGGHRFLVPIFIRIKYLKS